MGREEDDDDRSDDRSDRKRSDEDRDDAAGCSTAVAVAGLLVPLLVVMLVTAAVDWWSERDLRDVAALRTTTARVVDADGGGKWSRDRWTVAYTPAGGEERRAVVPVDIAFPADEGTEVEVAYDPDDPARVRTTRGWEPLYEHAGFLAAVLAAFVPLLLAFEALRRVWRRVRRG